MADDLTVTREIAPIPDRSEDAHKGDVGRLVVIGGCSGEVVMVGAPALAANAAFRSGAGLVQVLAPEPICASVAVLASCATTRRLPGEAEDLLRAVSDFSADAVGLGPGLGDSIEPEALARLVFECPAPLVVDADGLNTLSASPPPDKLDPCRVVFTPHPGELRRLLEARGVNQPIDRTAATRQAAARALFDSYGCTVVLKGRNTVVTNGDRIYTNETGNAGMATGGTGDVLTGVVAALAGQGMELFEAAILGVYLHGLAGDYAAEELGRTSMTALDLLDYLPEAFREHEMAEV
jgi:NAD(P)H-hydrate epimerase